MPLAAIAGIGAIGSIAGGIIGSNAAGHAADTQAAAANHAADLERQSATDALNFNKQQYGNSLNLLSPFYNTGVAANSRLAYLMGLNPAQGLPPGVINPNAPPTAGGGGGTGSLLDLLRSGALGDAFQNNPIVNRGTNGGTRQPMNAASLMPSNGAPLPTGNPGTPSFKNPDIGTFNAGSSGGNAGLLQIGPDGQPTGVTKDVNPMPSGANVNPGAIGDPSPFGPGGMGNIGGTTNASGAPGTVPRTDGGGTPSVPFGQTVGMLGDPSPFGSGGMGDITNPPGSFGSLAQGWNKTFQSPTDVTEQNDPGYQFRLQQGMQALQNSAAARGGLLSGGTAKALTDYNQNAASGEYSNVYNRALQNYNTNDNTFTNDQTNTFNRLMALQSGGQVSANNLSASGITAAGNAANIGLTSAGQIGQQLNNAGAATASGYVGSANAINGAIGGATNSLSTLALLQQLQRQGAGAGAGGAGV